MVLLSISFSLRGQMFSVDCGFLILDILSFMLFNISGFSISKLMFEFISRMFFTYNAQPALVKKDVF